MKPVVVDLYCKAGGAGRGYQAAGFYVIGVDKDAQPNYAGDEFFQEDAVRVLEHLVRHWAGNTEAWAFGHRIAGVHASPPCQPSSNLRHLWKDREHPEMIPATRALLLELGLPFVIENVVGAKLINPTMLCGSAFGLGVRRHRLFETSFPMMSPGCAHGQQPFAVPVYGHTGAGANRGLERKLGRTNGVADWRKAMGIDWMTVDELAQAIPPAYTEHIGSYLMKAIAAPLRPRRSGMTPHLQEAARRRLSPSDYKGEM